MKLKDTEADLNLNLNLNLKLNLRPLVYKLLTWNLDLNLNLLQAVVMLVAGHHVRSLEAPLFVEVLIAVDRLLAIPQTAKVIHQVLLWVPADIMK
jgi:hypothetical protein